MKSWEGPSLPHLPHQNLWPLSYIFASTQMWLEGRPPFSWPLPKSENFPLVLRGNFSSGLMELYQCCAGPAQGMSLPWKQGGQELSFGFVAWASVGKLWPLITSHFQSAPKPSLFALTVTEASVGSLKVDEPIEIAVFSLNGEECNMKINRNFLYFKQIYVSMEIVPVNSLKVKSELAKKKVCLIRSKKSRHILSSFTQN